MEHNINIMILLEYCVAYAVVETLAVLRPFWPTAWLVRPNLMSNNENGTSQIVVIVVESFVRAFSHTNAA